MASSPFRYDELPFEKARSTNAIQFPKSSQLKPLDLAHPFYPRPNGPKRRATLPTLNVASRGSDSAEAAIVSPPDSGLAGMGPDPHFGIPESEIGLAVTTLMDKRKSRSANDLKQAMTRQPSSRKRSAEIRFWRESFAGDILLHPNTPPDAPADDNPMDRDYDEDNNDHNAVTSHLDSEAPLPRGTGSATASLRSEPRTPAPAFVEPQPSTAGVERPDDLERRVADLESSLQRFHLSLDHLTASKRSSSRSPASDTQSLPRQQHTPSILVDTLQDPSWRPASLEQYRQHSDGVQYDNEDAGEVLEREWGSNGTYTPLGARESSKTFTTLYNMLGEERAARLRLETELRNLQREVTSMATRLERGSWNSYHVRPLPSQHRPRTPDESVRGASSHGAYDQRIVSRFSGSDSFVESEIYGLNSSRMGHRADLPEEQVQTPTYNMYRTPLEEHGPYRYNRDDMF